MGSANTIFNDAYGKKEWYLDIDTSNTVFIGFRTSLAYFLLLNQFVPIGIIIFMEIAKLI
jgi:hypothetical protein